MRAASFCFIIGWLLCQLLACTPPPKAVVHYNAAFAGRHEVVIDDTLALTSDTSHLFKGLFLSAGSHSVSIDGQPSQTFEVPKEGGILNLAAEPFILYSVKFVKGKEDLSPPKSGHRPHALILDSLVLASDHVQNQIQEGNLTIEQLRKSGDGDPSTDLFRTPANQLFIPKTWDIDINKTLPTTTKELLDPTHQNLTIYKKHIANQSTFVTEAIATKNQYFAVPITFYQ